MDTFLVMKDEQPVDDLMQVFANTEEQLTKLYPNNVEMKETLSNVLETITPPQEVTPQEVTPQAKPAKPTEQTPQEEATQEATQEAIQEATQEEQEEQEDQEEHTPQEESGEPLVMPQAEPNEKTTLGYLAEEAYVAPLRHRSVNIARYEVVSGDIVLDMGDEIFEPNEECCLVKWFRDVFKSLNEKHD
jgi:hypothetical protein